MLKTLNKTIFWIYALVFITSLNASAQSTQCALLLSDKANSSYSKYESILEQNRNAELLKSNVPLVEKSYGTEVPVVHSFEAEGLGLGNIRKWFNETRPSFKQNLRKAFEQEASLPAGKQLFRKWLANVKIESDRFTDDIIDWGAMNLEERLAYLMTSENPLKLLTSGQADELFETRAVTYNDVITNNKAPVGVTVGDDGGSWEVRSLMGQINRADFLKLRTDVEDFLDQKIGHQHLFHAWPADSATRKALAPKYIDLLDSTTWFLYWRQMKRTDVDVRNRTVVDHPYLGVYSTNSLARLQRVVEENRPGDFHDKYRLVGARNFKASDEIPEQSGDVPDWEIRSGNKGMMREFVEATLESRLVTGDYSGLNSFGSYDFNSQASVHSLTHSYLTQGEVEILERFQELFPLMKWSSNPRAKNNYRTKIIAPLLPWQNRLNLDYKADLVKTAQIAYAKSLVNIGRDYVKLVQDPQTTRTQMLEARKRSLIQIKRSLRTFANNTRLDLDFELYLKPHPENDIPAVTVNSSGMLDVNKIDLGIEYSVRLPVNLSFQSVQDAQVGILKLAQKFATKTSSSAPQSLDMDGHGHGISVKYTVEDKNQDTWRFEWDGIMRDYQDGEVVSAHGGHIEIVTPKFSPQSIQGPISDLYTQARSMGLLPRRNAGGAHINFDLAPLKQLPTPQGTRALLNLLSYFESNREVVLFMWQHPRRAHAAYPVIRTEIMAKRFKNFQGDWKDLGRMLYETRYFNTFVNRKPKYVPINLTALMTPIIPAEYVEKTLDIKNTTQKWFPNFNKVYGRGEVRLFDAPTDEKMAALHIKYFRALMNRTFNSTKQIDIKPQYSERDIQKWKKSPSAWIAAAESHLADLGLDPTEFRSLLWDSYLNQLTFEPRQVDYEVYQEFLPPAN